MAATFGVNLPNPFAIAGQFPTQKTQDPTQDPYYSYAKQWYKNNMGLSDARAGDKALEYVLAAQNQKPMTTEYGLYKSMYEQGVNHATAVKRVLGSSASGAYGGAGTTGGPTIQLPVTDVTPASLGGGSMDYASFVKMVQEAIGPEGAGGLGDLTQTPEYQQMQEAIATTQQNVAQQQEATAAAQEQYQQIATDYEKRDEELTSYLEGLGADERQRLEQRRAQLKAAAKEDLMKRGLTSTTALDAAMRGVDIQADESLRALEERLQSQTLQLRSQLSGETLAAQERAAGFASQMSAANFAAAQEVPTTMSELAEMLAKQRIAGIQNQTSSLGGALGAYASMYGSSVGAATDIYRANLGAESEAAQRNLERWQTNKQTGLGYAQLQNALEQEKLRGMYGAKQARISSGQKLIPGGPLTRSRSNVTVSSGFGGF